MMTVTELATQIETTLTTVIQTGFTHSHYENTITENILTKFRERFNNIGIQMRQYSTDILRINWDAFKQRGKPETSFGDVAIWVRIHKNNRRDIIEGVAYLEAKMSSGGVYRAFKFSQIELINSNAPRSFVLCYDDRPYMVPAQSINISSNPQLSLSQITGTHALVIPTNIVVAQKKLSRGLYTFSLPFSHQLCYRYLFGLDLEFRLFEV